MYNGNPSECPGDQAPLEQSLSPSGQIYNPTGENSQIRPKTLAKRAISINFGRVGLRFRFPFVVADTKNTVRTNNNTMPSHGDDDCAAIVSMFAAIDATVNATFNLQQDGDGDGSHGQPHQKLPKSKRRKFGVALNHHLQ